MVKRGLRLAVVFMLTAVVVWGVWRVENTLGEETQAVVSVAEAAESLFGCRY